MTAVKISSTCLLVQVQSAVLADLIILYCVQMLHPAAGINQYDCTPDTMKYADTTHTNPSSCKLQIVTASDIFIATILVPGCPSSHNIHIISLSSEKLFTCNVNKTFRLCSNLKRWKYLLVRTRQDYPDLHTHEFPQYVSEKQVVHFTSEVVIVKKQYQAT